MAFRVTDAAPLVKWRAPRDNLQGRLSAKAGRVKGVSVLFENDFCMALGKPAGLAAQGGAGVGVSLDSLLSQKYSPRPLLVHRLDRDTSGVILVAKSREAAVRFSALLSGGGRQGASAVKQYLGVCAGIPDPRQGIIRLKLEALGEARRKAPQESETRYKVLQAPDAGSAGDGLCFSLLELELGTGRMHQIRRHLARISCPLLGDDKYGDFPLNKRLRKELGLRRLLLHAWRLALPPAPPFLPEGLDIRAPLPDYFSPYLSGDI